MTDIREAPFAASESPFPAPPPVSANSDPLVPSIPPSSSSLSQRQVLPAVYQDSRGSLRTLNPADPQSLLNFLETDLNLSRLNKIHKHLWLAGLPRCARPLHHQVLVGRSLVITERSDLHLVWDDRRVFLKPLPEYLLIHSSWSTICANSKLFETANGLLLSYLWLVCNKSDFRIAKDTELLPTDLTWERWTAFSSVLMKSLHHDTLKHVNPRFLYGELRLPRLNLVYRLCSKTTSASALVRGYHYGYYQYSTFVERNFAWCLTVIIYITVVLTALQVGLGTEELRNNRSFNRASYGFTIFSILAPLILTGVVGGVILTLVIFNLLYALRTRSKKRKEYPFVSDSQTLKDYGHSAAF